MVSGFLCRFQRGVYFLLACSFGLSCSFGILLRFKLGIGGILLFFQLGTNARCFAEVFERLLKFVGLLQVLDLLFGILDVLDGHQVVGVNLCLCTSNKVVELLLKTVPCGCSLLGKLRSLATCGFSRLCLCSLCICGGFVLSGLCFSRSILFTHALSICTRQHIAAFAGHTQPVSQTKQRSNFKSGLGLLNVCLDGFRISDALVGRSTAQRLIAHHHAGTNSGVLSS